MKIVNDILQSLTHFPEKTQALIDEGIREFQKTNDYQAGYDLVIEMQSLGFITDALYLVNGLYRCYPDEAFVLLKAELLIDDNQIDEAIDVLLTISEDSDDYIAALLILADAYQQIELNEVALEKLKRAKQLAGDEPVVDLAIYEQYAHVGNYVDALRALERIEQSGIISEVSYIKKVSHTLNALGEYEEAIVALEQLSDDDHDSSTRFELGLAYFQIDEFQRSHHHLKQLIDLDPDFYSAYYYLGRAASELGYQEESISYFEQAIAYNPYHEALYVVLFDSYRQIKNDEALQTLIHQAEQHNIDSLSWHLKRAHYLFDCADYEEMTDYVLDVLNSDDEESELYWLLASAYAQLEEDELAMQWYTKSYHLFAQDTEFLNEYALYLREIGKREEYTKIVNELVALDNTFSEEFGEEF